MIDGGKYLRLLSKFQPAARRCLHCASTTYSINGKPSFCNFCEQYTGSGVEQAAETPFSAVRSQIDANGWDAAEKTASQLIKGNKDPEQLYLIGVFYHELSTIRFQSRDYNQMGFMEKNAVNIRDSLDLTMKWKECFFKVIKIVGDELQGNVQVDPELVFIKLVSELRLRRFVEAAATLKVLQNLDKHGILIGYAQLAYNVERNTKQAEASLASMLPQSEINTYYYLAKYLAKNKKLREAELLIELLGKTSEVLSSRELLYKIRLAQEASKM